MGVAEHVLSYTYRHKQQSATSTRAGLLVMGKARMEEVKVCDEESRILLLEGWAENASRESCRSVCFPVGINARSAW
jgi:hypothetical protein